MKSYLLCLLNVVSIGCNTEREPATASRTRELALEAISGLRFRHELSKANVGQNPSEMSDQGFSKLVGSEGVFAVDDANGTASFVPNADARVASRPPYPGRADDHHAKALEYFLAAGLPKDQIGGLQVHTLMRGGQFVTGQRMVDTLVGYYSILTRQVGGVVVGDSFAWVRFNVDGDVVSESVYWPELPASLRAQVDAFQAAVSTPEREALFKGVIERNAPGHSSVPGKIVIHHRISTDRGSDWALVTYDATLHENRARTRSFDSAGNEIVLPQEKVSAIPTTREGIK